jgi:hypothetical protein
LLNALGESVAYDDEELARTVLWLFALLNDLYRSDRGKLGLTTLEANLRADALKAIDLATDKQKAIREVHALLQRRLKHVTRETVRGWRREQRRHKDQQRSKNPAVQKRLDLGLPPEAGGTDEARYRWLIARIARATEPAVRV